MTDQLKEINDALNAEHKLPTPLMSGDLAGMVFPPVKWAVPGLLPEGVSILGGKPKMGKSWMALNIACAIAEGGKALSSIQVDKGEVMYLAMEDNARRLQTRANVVTDGQIPSGIHFFTTWHRMDELGLEELDKYLELNSAIRLVIIDTLAKIKPRGRGFSQYEDDYGAIGDIHGIAHKYQIAILIIHHLKKQATDDPMDQISGTLGLNGAADGMLVLDRQRGKGDAVLHVTGRDIEEDQAYALEWIQDIATWTIIGDVVCMQETVERESIRKAIEASEVPLTARQIAADAEMEYDNARQLIYRMENEGTIKRAGGNQATGFTYSLSPYYNHNSYYNQD